MALQAADSQTGQDRTGQKLFILNKIIKQLFGSDIKAVVHMDSTSQQRAVESGHSLGLNTPGA